MNKNKGKRVSDKILMIGKNEKFQTPLKLSAGGIFGSFSSMPDLGTVPPQFEEMSTISLLKTLPISLLKSLLETPLLKPLSFLFSTGSKISRMHKIYIIYIIAFSTIGIIAISLFDKPKKP